MADPLWANVVLRLPFDIGFQDESDDARAVTVSNMELIGFAKFGAAARFISTSNFLVAAAGLEPVAQFSQDWTLDYWFRTFESRTNIHVSIGGTNNFDNDGVHLGVNFSEFPYVQIWQGGTSADYTGTVAVSSSGWTHVAWECDVSASELKCYVGGVLSLTVPLSGTYGANMPDFALRLGQVTTGGLEIQSGRLDDLSLTLGALRYGAPFTPPTTAYDLPPLPAQPVEDPLWGNVTLLLPFDGTNGDVTTTDLSPLENSVTFNGTAEISNVQSRFGGTSLKMPGGTASWLDVPNSNALIDFNGDFSIDFWVWIDPASPNGYAVTSWDDATGEAGLDMLLIVSSGQVILDYDIYGPGNGRVALSTTTNEWDMPTGAWHYLEFTRSGNEYFAFLNGILADSRTDTDTLADTNPMFNIGGSEDGYGTILGYIDDLRITNGAARNTSAYRVVEEANQTSGETPTDVRAFFPSPLGAPMVRVDLSTGMVASFPSPLGAPRVYVLNDFSSLVTDPSMRYVMRVTGSPAVEIPISSWQATLQTDRLQYLQCVVPAATQYLTLLSERRGEAEIVIYRVGVAGSQNVESEMARAPLSQIIVNSGPRRETATVSGYANPQTDAVYPPIVSLKGIRSMSQTLGGNSRARAEIDWFLRPGQEVSADGVTFTAGYINYFVPARGDAYMDVGSRG